MDRQYRGKRGGTLNELRRMARNTEDYGRRTNESPTPTGYSGKVKKTDKNMCI